MRTHSRNQTLHATRKTMDGRRPGAGAAGDQGADRDACGSAGRNRAAAGLYAFVAAAM